MNETTFTTAHHTASRTSELVLSALVAALMVASAWISIPVGAVPVTLQVFVVVLAALLLSPAGAGAAMLVYLALGTAGVPAFSGGQAGVGVLAGPTGGYLYGFALGALIGSAVRGVIAGAQGRAVRRHGGTRVAASARPRLWTTPSLADGLAALVVVVVVYTCGVLQLSIVAGLSLGQAVLAGAVPFLAADAMKAAAAAVIARSIRRARAQIG